MRFTVCESISPPVKELIQEHYIPWYCDVDDTSREYLAYTSGLVGPWKLPLIAVIDPVAPDTYLNRTTGIQSPADFYSRLWIPTGGDVDHSGVITLTDAILTLQIITSVIPSVPVYVDGDINDDKRLGIAEAVYVLNSLAQ